MNENTHLEAAKSVSNNKSRQEMSRREFTVGSLSSLSLLNKIQFIGEFSSNADERVGQVAKLSEEQFKLVWETTTAFSEAMKGLLYTYIQGLEFRLGQITREKKDNLGLVTA